MADSNDSGDKTELPTQKRLRDARKKGNVPKSRDVTSTIGLLVWVLLLGAVVPYGCEQMIGLTQACIQLASEPISKWDVHLKTLGSQAIHVLTVLTAMVFVPCITIGVLTEFLQAGPVFSTEKLQLKAENLNPVQGLKRMFSMDSWIELFKNIAKTSLVLWIGWRVASSVIPQLPQLTEGTALGLSALMWDTAYRVIVDVAGLFVVVALLDALWQRHSFTKKMMMSMHDIKEETKNSEGDPMIKGQRRQMHQEWSQESAKQSAKSATALVVNPTHVAIAIEYDRTTCPIPIVTAKEEDDVAMAMREAAREAGVPVVRNIELARTLLARSEVGDIVPQDLFNIIAEVVLWAKEARTEVERCRADPWSTPQPTRAKAPGRDLTRYRADDQNPTDGDDGDDNTINPPDSDATDTWKHTHV